MNFVRPEVREKNGMPPYGLSFIPTLEPDVSDSQDYIEGHHFFRPQERDNSPEVLELVREYARLVPEGSSVFEIGVGAYEPELSITHAVLGALGPGVSYFGVDIKSRSLPEPARFLQTDSKNHDLVRQWMLDNQANPIRLFIIDGDHSVNGALSDWKYVEWIAKDATILMHDSNSHPGPIAILEALGPEWSVYEPLIGKQDYGMAIIQKRT